ncbi:MAG TPA: acylneuraminate cytidylyltransferase family protein [Bdellovibrionota bacterium]|nr:acylneuraminate cytidylyltransferase family protein [Bdellovibrionota bacterium]
MKGHSERVPNKNVRLLAGKPLCHHILEALASAKYVGDIYVDTDSSEIAETAKTAFNAHIIDRPPRLRGDRIPMTDILVHDISLVEGDVFLQTHATNPLLRPETIDAAIEAFFSAPNVDSLFSVTPLQTRLYWENGRAINHDPAVLLRTQDLPPVYEENSNLYIFTRTCLASTGRRIGENPILFKMSREEALDIDTEYDFRVAELFHKEKRGT